MSDEIYFQWQNDILRKTIYPLREMKLRDFLVFYREIELWEENKNLSPQVFENETKKYRDSQKKIMLQVIETQNTLRGYFLNDQVDAIYQQKFLEIDPVEMAQVNKMHGLFKQYFPQVNGVWKEKYFLSQRVAYWEQHRKSLAHDVAECERRIRNWANFPQYAAKLESEQVKRKKLKDFVLPMADYELDRLYEFLSVYGKLEKRRAEAEKRQKSAEKNKGEIDSKLRMNQMRLAPVEDSYKKASAELIRLRHVPDFAALEPYLTNVDVFAQLRAKFPDASQELAGAVNGWHGAIKKKLPFNKEDYGKRTVLQQQVEQIKSYRKSIELQIYRLERELAPLDAVHPARAGKESAIRQLRETNLGVVDQELNLLDDAIFALTYSKKPAADLNKMTQQKEIEVAKMGESLTQLRNEKTSLDRELAALDGSLNVPDAAGMVDYIDKKSVSVQDIVAGKVEEYKLSLTDLDHMQLLELVVKRFLAKPEDYPLWLQYMVVHFSGMRYQSAHGSWADPKDLLINMRASAIEKRLKKLDDGGIDALCEEKLSYYEPLVARFSSSVQNVAFGASVDDLDLYLAPEMNPDPPKLSETDDPKWVDKIEDRLKGLKSTYNYLQRKALLDLSLDEINYEVNSMKPEEVLDALEDLQDYLPQWMWKEIVKLTELRTNHVEDDTWEGLTPDEEVERDNKRWSAMRNIVSEWRQDYIGGWRGEHAQSDRLIVIRAVCNEVAEHIQHVRGLVPPGGLTAKPNWYLREEKKYLTNPAAYGKEKPRFLKPAKVEDFKEGSSILWLRFVPDFPNPWRIAKPLKLNNGDDMFPSGMFSRNDAYRSRQGWGYEYNEGWIKRSRSATDASGARYTQQEWLRWMHEATVAKTAETAEGTVVLTFETALPNEDKRLSTIGVFKRYVSDLKHTITGDNINGTFVGFIPEGVTPAENLEDMLDWNKILLNEVLTPEKLEEWQHKYLWKNRPRPQVNFSPI